MIMITISTMDAMKNIPTRGTTSLVAGIMSATTNMKTVIAKSSVIAREIRSPWKIYEEYIHFKDEFA